MSRKLLTLFGVLTFPFLTVSAQENVTGAADRTAQVMYLIEHYYLDTVSFSPIADAAITAMLEKLDPHSSFISAADVQATNEPLKGEFEGIGVQFAIIRDTLTVQEPVAGGPSQKVGILTGDKIIAVNGNNIAGTGLTNKDVFGLLRGPKGTKVELTIIRRGEREPLNFTVTRDQIPLNSLEAGYQYPDGILYLKLSRFAAKSNNEIIAAVSACKQPITGVILDLRDNSGGFLPTAIDIADQFLSKGELIVYAEGRKLKPHYEYADGKGLLQKVPLVVMIDENSASASEIVAGAVQDQDRGVVIGRRSFGKGLVQQQMKLSDGSQVRLTIARYHTPSGRVIQSPYEEGHKDEYYQNFLMRYMHGENLSADSIQMPDSLKFKTLKKDRTVYGGGGIMPDVFIPQDTTGYSPYYSQLLRKGIVPEYVNETVDIHRKAWQKKYGTLEEFIAGFDSDGAIFEGLITFAEGKGLERNDEQILTSKDNITRYMKSLAASDIFGREAFYRAQYAGTEEMEKALELVRQGAKVE